MKEIILFDKVLIEKERTTNDLTPGELQTLERALKKGIIVNPKANMFRVQNYLDTLIDKPTTLFSSFEKVRQTADEILLMKLCNTMQVHTVLIIQVKYTYHQ